MKSTGSSFVNWILLKFLKCSSYVAITVILICIGILSARNGGALTYDLMVSFVAGAVFWILACWLPDLAKKRLIRNTLNWQYHEFKRVMIDILCTAGGFQASESEKEKFFDCKNFIKYFGANNEHGDRVAAAMSGLDRNQVLLDDLLYEFHWLSQMIGEIKMSLAYTDEIQLKQLCFLEKRLYDFENKPCYKGDITKYIGEFLFEVFGGFSQIKGETKIDWIQKCIDSI